MVKHPKRCYHLIPYRRIIDDGSAGKLISETAPRKPKKYISQPIIEEYQGAVGITYLKDIIPFSTGRKFERKTIQVLLYIKQYGYQ